MLPPAGLRALPPVGGLRPAGQDDRGASRGGHTSWESHAQDIVGGSDPFFVNFGAGNYAIGSTSVAYRNGGPIPADVAAALGVSTAAGQHRGAFSWAGQ